MTSKRDCRDARRGRVPIAGRTVGWVMAALLSAAAASSADAQSLRDAFRRTSPSVVIVQAEQKAVATPMSLLPTQPQQGHTLSQGAGVLVTADGRILTAAHVVQLANRIEVEFANGVRLPARVVASAPFADLALLQVAEVPPGVQPARLGDSNALDVGDQIFAVGTPHGLSHSLSVGWVSGRRGPEKASENLVALEILQIDMAVYEGNSGGPVFNLAGEVVGIISHMLLQVGAATGPGFAVASNVARRLMLESGTVWLGVETYQIEGSLAALFNVPQAAGLLVQSVATDSFGARLGLRDGQLRIAVEGQPLIAGGDIVLEMLGHQVQPTPASLRVIEAALARLQPGDRVTLKVLRAGRVIELTSEIPPK